MKRPSAWFSIFVAVLAMASAQARAGGVWKVGIAKARITPEKPIWLGGYAARDHAAEGTLQDLWVKVLAIEDTQGHRAVFMTSDLLGLTKPVYEHLVHELQDRYRLDRRQVMLTSSHTHCGPVLRDSLYDCYVLNEQQIKDIEEYSHSLEQSIVATVGQALSKMTPARFEAGEGTARFAVNRRNNLEKDVPALMAAHTPLKGPVDHSVPVLAVKGEGGELLAVVFGYACHNTTLNFYQWCGDYAGFAQAALEKAHPGTSAMFWQGCGGDQNPLPRRTVELCQKYGNMLADSVEEALRKPLRPLEPKLRTSFEFVELGFDQIPAAEELQNIASRGGIDGRWAQRQLRLLSEKKSPSVTYPYPVEVWLLGDQLWIALGGEPVVDYALLFKQRFGPQTWVTGYTNDVMAYIPSRRVWTEGGYESGALREYGQPSDRWAGDVEERITTEVTKQVGLAGR